MQGIYIVYGVFAFTLLWGVLVFNTLVSERNTIENARAGIDVQLRKRYDLVPNLVATVKGYASHEKALLLHITQLRIEAMQTVVPAHKHRADTELANSMRQLFAVAENYPELKANKGFLQLQSALNEIEAQLAAARRTFNTCVTEYNNTVQSFPGSLIASMFGFKEHRWFEIQEEERHPPKIAGSL